MRRFVVILVVLAALVVPAVVLAAPHGGDGSLVVKNGTSPTGPVVVMQINGSVIGQIDDGKIVIDPGPNPGTDVDYGATGWEWRRGSTVSDTAFVWGGHQPFKFRAVGGKFTVLIYGTGVNVVAVGKGWVKLAGTPSTPNGDGRYSLNGADFASLPGTQTDKLSLPANG
jgi:hypothetical protein